MRFPLAFPVSSFQFRVFVLVSGFQFPVSSFWFLFSVFRFLVCSPVSGFKFLAGLPGASASLFFTNLINNPQRSSVEVPKWVEALIIWSGYRSRISKSKAIVLIGSVK